MHQALYRKWRPQTFDDVYGQEHITQYLNMKRRIISFLTHIFSAVRVERVKPLVQKYFQRRLTVSRR